MSSDHEFDAYDLSEFTEDDFARFDAEVVRSSKCGEETISKSTTDNAEDCRPIPAHSGVPDVTISLEHSTNVCVDVVNASPGQIQATLDSFGFKAKPIPLGTRSLDSRSPYKTYRAWRGALSVTDLVGPVWCEVQFDYGLRQKRHKRLEERPKSFATSSGKIITVKDNVAAQNNRTVKRGQSVHTELEREVHPVVITIFTKTEEERWGLRLHNLTVGLEEILQTGKTRELPVFGILQNEVIIGIIDEVIKCGDHGTDTTPARKRQRLLESTSLGDGFTTVPDGPICETADPQTTGEPLDRFMLHVLDTKTRRTDHLPTDDDAYSSKLQLMLYFKLIHSLISPEIMDFSAVWKRMCLKPKRRFSTKFTQDTMLPNEAGVYLMAGHANLELFVERWWKTVEKAKSTYGLTGVDRELQLVYRTQPKKTRAKCKRKDRVQNDVEVCAIQEEVDIARAIAASLQDLAGSKIDTDGGLSNSNDLAKGDEIGEGFKLFRGKHDVTEELPGLLEEDPELAWALHTSLGMSSIGKQRRNGNTATESDETGVSSPSRPSTPTRRSPNPGSGLTTSTILGTKEFDMDESVLDSHLTGVLEWWHGKRAPVGVNISHSRRCFTCEYCDGCEWREEKAAEALEKLKGRKQNCQVDF